MPEAAVPWYTLEEVDDVPTGPGLYAWYVVPVAGPPDWATANSLGKLLSRHTRTLRHPPMALAVEWHLGAVWSGDLPEGGMADLATLIEGLAAGDQTEPAKDLGKVLGDAGHRAVLAEVLVRAAPRLNSPMYVGISRGLRSRLKTHRKNYSDARTAMGAGQDPLVDIGNKLGVRLALARIPPEALRVTALEVLSLQGLTTVEARRIAAAAEYVVNRWQHPLFGEK